MIGTRNVKKRSERYISYRTEQIPSGEYKITINYFIDNGNPVREIDLQRVKYIICSQQELISKEKEIQNIINETKFRLIRSLHALGANELNVESFIRNKIR